MTKRTLGVALTTVAVVAAAPTVGSAATKTTTKPTIQILGGSSFVANRYIKDTIRFDKDVYQLKSGVKIQITNKTEEPHTVSVVSRSDFPRTIRGFDTCFEKGVCGQLGQAHGFPEGGEGPPTTPLVNKGLAGFDTKGDSVATGPKAKTSVQLSAKKGKSLYLLCIIHPWQQAKISVK